MTSMTNFDFLRCPITKQNFLPVSNELLLEINNSIRSRNIFYYDGREVTDQLEYAFINEDSSIIYMVKSGIIWLISNFAIINDKEKITIDTNKNFYKNAVKDFYDDIGWKKEPDKNYTDAKLFEDLREVSQTYIKNYRLRSYEYFDISCSSIQGIYQDVQDN